MGSLVRAVTTGFGLVAYPFFLLDICLKGLLKPTYRKGWLSRFLPKVKGPFDVWIHAVSVGEARCAVYVRQQLSNMRVLMTTTTPTGRLIVTQKGLMPGDQHVYLPIDAPLAMRSLVRQARCSTLIVMETELWPQLLWAAGDQSMRVIIYNGRMSKRSFSRYWSTRWLWRLIAQTVYRVYPESTESADRFKKLGFQVSEETSHNIKYLLSKHLPPASWALDWKNRHNGPIFIAACTHPGEEDLVWNAWKKSLWNKGRCVIIPRHPERSVKVLSLMENVSLMSSSEWARHAVEDRLSVLNNWYAIADIVVLGGGFAAKGGHNPLEAAVYSLPVVVGGNTFNFKSMYESLVEQGAVVQTDSGNLLDVLNDLYERNAFRKSVGDCLYQHWKHGQRNAKSQLDRALLDVTVER